MTYRKKLIEVALPLEAISKEAAREKSIRHGHPSTLHLWWSRKPLAACRAVLFASLVDDPSEYIKRGEEAVRSERDRLFKIIEELVMWGNVDNEDVIDKARLEIARSVARSYNVPAPIGREAVREFLATKAPPVLDPFAGGGSIPLEAQRLGLRAYASDLNPVAVLINMAMIEIPPKFAGMSPVHPPESNDDHGAQQNLWNHEWRGAEGLAEDVRFYGKCVRDGAFSRIGRLFPKAKITPHMLTGRRDLVGQGLKMGDEVPVAAWLWGRTVKCPNPACGATIPLVRSFELSKRKGHQVWLQPVLNKQERTVHFEVGIDMPPLVGFKSVAHGTSLVNDRGKALKAAFQCMVCGNGIAKGDYIDSEANQGRLGVMPLAIVAQADRRRIYLSFPEEQSKAILQESSEFLAHSDLADSLPREPARGTFASNAQGRIYGFKTFADYFTTRQLVTLATFGALIPEIQSRVRVEAIRSGCPEGRAASYAKAVSLYVGLAVSKLADRNSSVVSWDVGSESLRSTFARQGIQMMWGYCESNPFEEMGSLEGAIDWIYRLLPLLPATPQGEAAQADASKALMPVISPLISTDPPYYGNVAYGDLSDFFYVWLRRGLLQTYPGLFATVLTPKAAEIKPTPFTSAADKPEAHHFFEETLGRAFLLMHENVSVDYPLTVYYAFKQAEEEQDSQSDQWGIASTGWETMLEGLIAAGFQITGTWPIRTELSNRPVATGANALASSIVLVCRPLPDNAPTVSRRDFLSVLKKELPPALRELQQGYIAPVDLAQAAIGPGMAVFSRHKAVLESDGSAMHVRTALALINQSLDEYLSEQEGEYESDTRWALSWYEQFGHNEGVFGVAETLSKAKNTSVGGLVEAGILEARAGKVRLLRRDELDTDWDPDKDKRLTSWEAVQHLIHALDTSGEEAAAELVARLGSVAETARDLAYRLYTVCERKGRAQEALGYNMLVVAWPKLKELASRADNQPELPL